MINVLVKLQIKDFNALKEFESQAVRIMKIHRGRILSAFETIHEADGSGEEIHILEFPDETCFAGYRADKSLKKLAALRAKAISDTETTISIRTKSYT